MYLHLGQDTEVKTGDIIGIFDMDNATVAKGTKRFLAVAERSGQVVNVTSELPKTFVLCHTRKGGSKVYISQISSATLRKRTKYIDHIANV